MYTNSFLKEWKVHENTKLLLQPTPLNSHMDWQYVMYSISGTQLSQTATQSDWEIQFSRKYTSWEMRSLVPTENSQTMC